MDVDVYDQRRGPESEKLCMPGYFPCSFGMKFAYRS